MKSERKGKLARTKFEPYQSIVPKGRKWLLDFAQINSSAKHSEYPNIRTTIVASPTNPRDTQATELSPATTAPRLS